MAPRIDRYWDALADALPVLTVEEQHAAIALYRELAKGRPVGAEQLAAALSVPAATAEELLRRPRLRALIYPDEHGRVLGFGGLAAAPMHHKFRGARPHAVDVVRLGQPIHSRASRCDGSRRVA